MKKFVDNTVGPDSFYKTLHQRWKVARREWKRCCRKASEPRIHDLRVSLRRLLFSVALISEAFPDIIPSQSLVQTKQHFKKLSKLRDLQVMLQRLTTLTEQFSGINEIEKEVAKQVDQRINKIESYLRKNNSDEMMTLLPTIEQLQSRMYQAEQPIPVILLDKIAASYREVVAKHAGLQAKSPETIHALRIAFKKYRYQLEAVAEHIPLRSATTLKRMHAMQTLLGDIHDLDVLLDYLITQRKTRFGAKSRHYQRPILLLRKQRQELIGKLLTALPTMNSFSPNRLFAVTHLKMIP